MKSRPLGFVGVPADADDDEGLAGKLFCDLLHVRELFVAGAAPGGPEVDEDDAAAHGVEIELRAVEGGDGERRGHLVGGERGVFGEVLGAEIAGISGGDAGEAGFELVAGGVHLIETGEDLSVEVVGSGVFGVVGDGGFEGGVGGVEEIELVLVAGLNEEGVAALDFSVGLVGGVGGDGFERRCGGDGVFEVAGFHLGVEEFSETGLVFLRGNLAGLLEGVNGEGELLFPR